MRTLADQAMKLHEYMLRHQHKDVPLCDCIKVLKKYDTIVNGYCEPDEKPMCKAGLMYMMAIEELKDYKMRVH